MRLFGIPIKISPMFFVMAAIIAYFLGRSLIGTAIWMVIIFVSVLVHELGHGLVSKAFGQSPKIELVLFGGMTYPQGNKRISLGKEFLVVLAGPLFGFLLSFVAFILMALATESPVIYSILFATAVINIYWSLINLLPILPLDGGHLVRIFLEMLFGPRGWRIALLVSFALAAAGGVFFLFGGGLFIAIILFLFAFQNLESFRQTRGFTPVDRDPSIQSRLVEAAAANEAGNSQLAKKLYKEVITLTGDGVAHESATVALAEIYEKEGAIEKAYTLIKKLGKECSQNACCLLQKLAFEMKQYQEAILATNSCYRTLSTPDQVAEVATIAAKSAAQLGRVDETLEWLEAAQRSGAKLDEIIQEPDFTQIRDNEKVRAYLSRKKTS
ncbi:MAG: hypothetical protein S4CHLAM102_03080 [Chlamydiia bacterium]|nr:hypothetical protein [Chlamydiia bacterium]